MMGQAQRVALFVSVCSLLFAIYPKESLAEEKGPWPFRVGIHQRFRYEYLQNFTIQGPRRGVDGLLLERFRLDVTYHNGPFKGFFELQDAHGIDTDLNREDFGRKDPYENPIDLRQAYFAYTLPAFPLTIKAGRQIFSYWDNRIFGPGEWGNAGRYNWDAFKLMLKKRFFWLDTFYARQVYNDPYHFDGGHEPFHVWGAIGGLSWDAASFESFLTLKDGSAKGTLRRHEHRFSGGVRLRSAPYRGLDLQGLLIPQWGDLGGESIQAMGALAEVGYSLDLPWEPKLTLTYTYASGDKDRSDTTSNTFDGVFGAVDMYYGRMNLFSWQNLKDYQAGLELSPLEKMKAKLDYHFFTLDRSQDAWYFGMGNKVIRGKQVGEGSRLGHELDLVLKCKPCKNLEFQAGLGRFFPLERFKSLGADRGMNWYFFQTEWSFL
jgi:hypothetical protein